MNMTTSAALLALMLTCRATQASDWFSLKINSGTTEVFVDLSSIRVADGVRRGWFKFVYAPHTTHGAAEDANKWKTEDLNRVAFNCSTENYLIEAHTEYFDDGSNWLAPANDLLPWAPTPPDTVIRAAIQFICAWKPK
jgi:hypothetical protein